MDTLYWIAITNPKDQWHQQAKIVRDTLQATQLVTTELVLIEFLNYFCTYGSQMRRTVALVTRTILEQPEVEVIWHVRDAFNWGLTLCENRLDKGYSLVDCVSMEIMRQRAIADILSQDKHFAQEGFNLLL
ncbi:type II toxin-antitoxin system VapC family toxin [Lusitaniella coriacea]|uniref:type II toxin-antitoxin system VapC family toxin n=1 Tax=Lusitaniella coriacea TaxID=1983105 RepID=UPI003CE82728